MLASRPRFLVIENQTSVIVNCGGASRYNIGDIQSEAAYPADKPMVFQHVDKMPPESVRRNGRISKEITILLLGSDREGKFFSEQTKTVVLSRHGAGIISQHKLTPEQEMIIRRLDTNKEAEVRVVGQIGRQSENYAYGLALLDPNIEFWNIEFPPLTESEKEASHSLLECSTCKGREVVDHSDIESDVYEINEHVVRYCKCCGLSTIWKLASGDVANKSIALQSEPKPKPCLLPTATPLPASVRPENRRKRVRAKVNVAACIRHPGFGEEVVVCEDISRGGCRFTCHKRLFEESVVEIAVPYSPGASSIFVLAKIIYVHELSGQELFRCGAAYLASS